MFLAMFHEEEKPSQSIPSRTFFVLGFITAVLSLCTLGFLVLLWMTFA